MWQFLSIFLTLAHFACTDPIRCHVDISRTSSIVRSSGTWGDMNYRLGYVMNLCSDESSFGQFVGNVNNVSTKVQSRSATVEVPGQATVTFALVSSNVVGPQYFSMNITYRNAPNLSVVLCDRVYAGDVSSCIVDSMMPLLIIFFWLVPGVACGAFLVLAFMRKNRYEREQQLRLREENIKAGWQSPTRLARSPTKRTSDPLEREDSDALYRIPSEIQYQDTADVEVDEFNSTKLLEAAELRAQQMDLLVTQEARNVQNERFLVQQRLEEERKEGQRLEQERLERERAEQRRLEQEHLEQQRLEQERLEQQRLEQERLEQQRLKQERLEQERLERERAEQQRLEQERLEQQRLEQERLEQQRLEQERLERERAEQRRLEQEHLEQERLEQDRLERERAEQRRLEQERLEQERLEQDRLERERVEQNQSNRGCHKENNQLHCQEQELLEHGSPIGAEGIMESTLSLVDSQSEWRIPDNCSPGEAQRAEDMLAASQCYNSEYRELMLQLQRPAASECPKPFLGFSLAENVDDRNLVVDGVYVGGPAHQVGIRADDELVSIAQHPANSIQVARELVQKYCKPAEIAELTLRRPSSGEAFTVKLWVMTSEPRYRGKPYFFDTSLHEKQQSPRRKRRGGEKK